MRWCVPVLLCWLGAGVSANDSEFDYVGAILRDDVQPGDLPIKRVTDFAYVVNMDVARKLNIFPPVEILQVAETIN